MCGLQRFKQEFSDKNKKTQKTRDDKNNAYKEDKNNETLRKLYTIIWALRNKTVDITTDKLGIPIIDYKAEESIEKRIKGETMKAEDKFKLQYHVDTTEKESRDESRDIEASDDKTSKGIIIGDEEKE